MPGPATRFVGGPVSTGSVPYTTPSNPTDMGNALLVQNGVLVHNTTNAVSFQFNVPQNSQIVDILVDTTTAWNSATSDTLSVGIAAAGTDYASGVDVKTAAGRIRPTFTAAQLLAMSNVTTSTTVFATVTPVGSATAGNTIVTLIYQQVEDLLGGPTPV